MTPSEIETGKALAVLAYASALTGLPLWLLPFVMPDNRFAMAHARYAGAAWILGLLASLVVMMLIFVTCGLAFPLSGLLFLLWVPNIVGVINALNGNIDPPMGLFGFDEMIFGPFEASNQGAPPSAPPPASKPDTGAASDRAWHP